MSSLIEQARVKAATDTAAAWTAANKVLLAGEWGLETDTGYTKIGDGTTAWTSLSYYKPEIVKKSFELGWTVCTSWTAGATITITHNMGLNFGDYHKTLELRDPASPTAIFNGEIYYEFNSTFFGQMFNRSLSSNTIELQVGNLSNIYINTSGTSSVIPGTWEYNVVLKEI